MDLVEVKVGLRIPIFPDTPSEKMNATTLFNRGIEYLHPFEKTFESIWLCDHFYPWVEDLDPSTDSLENWTTLSYLAGIFKKFYLGAIVSCNLFRHPPLVAKMGATLHTLSNGRFILGIGAGWMESEYIAYGYGREFPSPVERVKRFDEALQIIRGMWTGKPVSFKGTYYYVKNVTCTPKMKSPPPIMIGAAGEKLMLRLVAKYADWWNYGCPSVERYEHKLRALKRHCSLVGRDPKDLMKTVTTFLALAKTEDEAKQIALRTVYPNWSRTGWHNLFIGTPKQLAERFNRLVDLGVEYLILRFLDFPKLDGTNLFLDYVYPQL